MTKLVLKQTFVLFLIAQHLNVQIQQSFATEATIQANSATQASLKLLENSLGDRLSKMSAERLATAAYRLYKLDVRLRNRVFRKSDDEIQNHIRNIKNGVVSINRNPDDEEIELTGEFTAQEGLGEVKETQAQSIPASFDISEIKKDKLIERADSVLVTLGANQNSDGSLSPLKKNEFIQKASQSGGRIGLKIFLSLLTLAIGLGVIGVMFVVLALAAWGGSVAAYWWCYVVIVGAVAGMAVLGHAIWKKRPDASIPAEIPVTNE